MLGDEGVTIANIHHHSSDSVIACNLLIQLPHSYDRGSINLKTEIIEKFLTQLTLQVSNDLLHHCPSQQSVVEGDDSSLPDQLETQLIVVVISSLNIIQLLSFMISFLYLPCQHQ